MHLEKINVKTSNKIYVIRFRISRITNISEMTKDKYDLSYDTNLTLIFLNNIFPIYIKQILKISVSSVKEYKPNFTLVP